MKDSFRKFTRPGNETLILACLHEVAEGVVPGRVPFDWDRLKGNMQNILPLLRSPESYDQDMIKFLRREKSFISRHWVLAIVPFANVRKTVLLVDSLPEFHGRRWKKSIIRLHGSSE